MPLTVTEQLFVLVAVTPYIAAWWWAIRILFGKRFVPWEWIPLAGCAFCVPYVLFDSFPTHPDTASLVAVIWMLLPVPIIVGTHAVGLWRRIRGNAVRKKLLMEIYEAQEEFAHGRCRLVTVDEIMTEIREKT